MHQEGENWQAFAFKVGKKRAHILEADGTPAEIEGYSVCYFRTAVTFTGYILSVGLLRLFFHWVPQWMLKCTHKLSPLSDAHKVLIRDSSGSTFIHTVVRLEDTYLDSSPNDVQETQHSAYFIYKQLKYIWSRNTGQFELLNSWEDKPYSELFPVKPLPEDLVTRRRALYGPNEIVIRLTPILTMVISECLNPFYCFQAFSCALWFFDDYWMYASCILLISSISLIVQVYEMRRNQRMLKRTVCSSAFVSVCREVNGFTEFLDVNSSELVPGDILEIPRNGCVMHCDALLLSGNCIVNESTLTGESVPVTKTPLPQRLEKDDVLNMRSIARHVLFGGTAVIQTRNYVDERVLAVVARTGFRTAKGELVRSILFPKPLEFKFTRDALKFVAALALLALVGFGVSIYLMHRIGSDIKTISLRALDLITIAVPPALPMAMTVGVVFAQRRLRAQSIHCINPSVINVCGVINVTCFDKTGTLTEDGLNLWGVIPNADGHFADPHFEPSELERGPLLETMATCHSLTLIEGVLSGDPLDLQMFQSTKWEFIEETEDYCKFEMAVPAIVRPCGKVSSVDIPSDPTYDSKKLPYEVAILRQFPFTSSLQRMSVITRVLDGSHFSVYTKGAPETIESLCRPDTIPVDFHSVLLEYTREGYRVLALAWRTLKISYTHALKIQRERVERDLLFLGLLVMENRLKPESAPVIQILRNANIRPVMVTGDNMLTAVSVARDCEMIDELDRIVIVSAKPPSTASIRTHANDTSAAGNQTAHHVAFVPHPILSRPSGSGTAPSAFAGSLLNDQQNMPLVEFHYAEDLHKPVTEVTATSGATARYWHTQHRRATAGVLSMFQSKKSTKRRWFGRRPQHSASKCSTRLEKLTNVDTISNTTKLSEGNDSSGRSASSVFDPPVPTPIGNSTHFASPRINIRMIDRPDFHLAISGKTWAIIREHYPWLIPKLVVKGTVFARFSPDQKTQLIEALQSVGYFVAMCGDGANDCGALKAAHAGVSLSEAEASVASPFTSKQQNISCIPRLIREGRCALVTSFGTLKFITGYSLIQSISVITLYYIGSSLSDGQFLYIDLFLITTLSVTFGYTKSYPHLSVEPPNMRLLSAVTLLSLLSQIVVYLVVQLVAFITVRMQPWYLPVFEFDEDAELCNYESTILFTVSAYQYLIAIVVFSKGAPYRRSMFSNYFFITNLAVCVALTVCLTATNFGIRMSWFELVNLPSPRFVLLLHLVVLANFLLCYLMELFIESVSFRRQLVHIHRALFPRYVQRKDYERIREEIDRLAGSWPPLIRSASIQALPKELFHDTDAVPPPTKPFTSRERRKTSTETDDEELLPADHLAETIVFHAPMVESSNTPDETTSSKHVPGPCDRSATTNRTSLKLSRSHSFDASELDLIKSRCQHIPEVAQEGPSGSDTDPATTSNFVDMPESLFHTQTQISPTPRNQTLQRRKRYQSSGPLSEPFYVQLGIESRQNHD